MVRDEPIEKPVVPILRRSLCLFVLALTQLIDSSPSCPSDGLPEGESTWNALDAQCSEEIRACEERHGYSTEGNLLTEECWLRPIDDEQQFFGPCLETLRDSERSDLDTIDWVLARVRLRQYFRDSGFKSVYKASESSADLQRVLEMEPDNYRVLEVSLRHADQFSVDQRLRLALRLPEPDPACMERFWFYVLTLGSIIEAIAINAEESTDVDLQELAAKDDNLRKAIDSAKSAYQKAYVSLHPYKKLQIGWAFVSDPFFGRILSRLGEGTLDKHRQFVIKDLRSEFRLGNESDPDMSLNMLCNDYAYELELMSSCLELVTHHWELDVAEFNKPSDTVLEAATRLVLANTRTCELPNYLTLPQVRFRVVFESTYCVPEIHVEINSEMNRLLDQFENLEDHPELLVLRAYTNTTNQVQIFERAIANDPKQVVHTILIAKRLNQLGFSANAERVIQSALEKVKDDDDAGFFECWFPRLDRFWSSSFAGAAHRLFVPGRERVTNAQRLIEVVQDVQNDDRFIPFLEGAYIADPPTSWSDTDYCDLSEKSVGITP